MIPHSSKIYNLRVTLVDTDSWGYQDLYFEFFDTPLSNAWIQDFVKTKSSDHTFRERRVMVAGSVVDRQKIEKKLNNVIDDINKFYDITIPKYDNISQQNLNDLHVYYEEFGQRADNGFSDSIKTLFFKFNNLIHDLEYSILNRTNQFGMWLTASYDLRTDHELSDEDFDSVTPIKSFGDLCLGFNTLGKNLQQAVINGDRELIKSRNLNFQKHWSNEILIPLIDFNNPSQQLSSYKKKWSNLDITDEFEYGNFKKNREGYIVIGQMVPQQKEKFFSHVTGVDKSLAKFNSIFSVDLVYKRSDRSYDDVKRLPVWKYPVKVQGPIIKEIRNEGTVFITWLLNNICNYACRYCPEVLHNGKNVKHDWNVVEPFIEHLNSFYQEKNINFAFTGGEPTLSPFFPTLIKKIYDLGHRSGITTNLSRTPRYIEENFVYLDYASCSFHPAYEIKNHTDTLYLEKLKLSSTITATNCRVMMDPDYWQQTIEFIEKVKELKIIDVQPVMIDSQYGYSSNIIKQINYTEEQFDWFAKFNYKKEYKKPDNEFYKIKENFSFAVFDDAEEKIIDPQAYINRGQTNFWNYKLMIGRESLFINHDGIIQRANCGVTGIAGTLDDWTNIDWERLKSPVSCPALMCHCGSDVLVSKKKVD
jgi:MoaA/NifB/PqqE/SkfB family radical SAM enzyme